MRPIVTLLACAVLLAGCQILPSWLGGKDGGGAQPPVPTETVYKVIDGQGIDPLITPSPAESAAPAPAPSPVERAPAPAATSPAATGEGSAPAATGSGYLVECAYPWQKPLQVTRATCLRGGGTPGEVIGPAPPPPELPPPRRRGRLDDLIGALE